jgi:hypothetical protein
MDPGAYVVIFGIVGLAGWAVYHVVTWARRVEHRER